MNLLATAEWTAGLFGFLDSCEMTSKRLNRIRESEKPGHFDVLG